MLMMHMIKQVLFTIIQQKLKKNIPAYWKWCCLNRQKADIENKQYFTTNSLDTSMNDKAVFLRCEAGNSKIKTVIQMMQV